MAKRRGRTPAAGAFIKGRETPHLGVDGDPRASHRSLGLAVRGAVVNRTTLEARRIGTIVGRPARGERS